MGWFDNQYSTQGRYRKTAIPKIRDAKDVLWAIIYYREFYKFRYRGYSQDFQSYFAFKSIFFFYENRK